MEQNLLILQTQSVFCIIDNSLLSFSCQSHDDNTTSFDLKGPFHWIRRASILLNQPVGSSPDDWDLRLHSWLWSVQRSARESSSHLNE